ncbi:hypothetical protein [Tenacibaculum finnmarkense]|nr:hypothetical protein [Tenacibaculum finnmarkense]
MFNDSASFPRAEHRRDAMHCVSTNNKTPTTKSVQDINNQKKPE